MPLGTSRHQSRAEPPLGRAARATLPLDLRCEQSRVRRRAHRCESRGPHQLPCGAHGEAQRHRHVNLETGTLKLGFLGHKWARFSQSHNLQTYRKTGLGGHHLSSDQQLWILVNSQWPNLCRVEAEMPTSLRIGNQQGLRGKYPGSCCQSICIRALSLHIITFEN